MGEPAIPAGSRTERLKTRISSEHKRLFEQAARLSGSTLTDFVINAVRDAANRVLREHALMELSLRDSELSANALLNPSAPSRGLRLAARRYKGKLGRRRESQAPCLSSGRRESWEHLGLLHALSDDNSAL
jgi:uncharacterized protein (DUF1778 family)